MLRPSLDHHVERPPENIVTIIQKMTRIACLVGAALPIGDLCSPLLADANHSSSTSHRTSDF